MGMENIWADENTQSVQGLLFRNFCREMMGVPVEYDDDAKRRNTHLILMPKVVNERLIIPEEESVQEIAVLVPAKRAVPSSKIPKEGTP